VNKVRKGVFVPTLTRKEAIDIYTVRANVESLATFLAVQAHNREPKGESLAKNLRAIHEKMKKAVAEKDLKGYMTHNSSFHETLILMCGNDLLIEMLQRFDKQTKRYRMSILSKIGKAEESVKKHEALIRSIEDGDALTAEKIRKEAILDNIALIEEIFKDEEEDIK
jgi:DNA-binding GntR family transcriptional regulator